MVRIILNFNVVSRIMPKAIHLCSFSGYAADLKGKDRTPQSVLQCLRSDPRLSVIDMDICWLRRCINDLEQSGAIIRVASQYPWHKWKINSGFPQLKSPANSVE